MFCPRSGTEFFDEDKFCSFCGWRFSADVFEAVRQARLREKRILDAFARECRARVEAEQLVDDMSDGVEEYISRRVQVAAQKLAEEYAQDAVDLANDLVEAKELGEAQEAEWQWRNALPNPHPNPNSNNKFNNSNPNWNPTPYSGVGPRSNFNPNPAQGSWSSPSSTGCDPYAVKWEESRRRMVAEDEAEDRERLSKTVPNVLASSYFLRNLALELVCRVCFPAWLIATALPTFAADGWKPGIPFPMLMILIVSILHIIGMGSSILAVVEHVRQNWRKEDEYAYVAKALFWTTVGVIALNFPIALLHHETGKWYFERVGLFF